MKCTSQEREQAAREIERSPAGVERPPDFVHLIRAQRVILILMACR